MTDQTLPLVDVHHPCPGYPCPQVRDGHGHDHTHTEVHLDGGCERARDGDQRRGELHEITCPECRIHWRLHGAGQPTLDQEGA